MLLMFFSRLAPTVSCMSHPLLLLLHKSHSWLFTCHAPAGECTERKQVAKLRLRGIGDADEEDSTEEREVDTAKPHVSRLPPVARTPNPGTVQVPQSSQQASTPRRQMSSSPQALHPLYAGRIPPQSGMLPSPLEGRRDSGWRTSVKSLHVAQGAAMRPTAQLCNGPLFKWATAVGHCSDIPERPWPSVQSAAITPAFQYIAGAEALDCARNPQPGGEGWRPRPLNSSADALGFTSKDLPVIRALARGGILGYMRAAWPSDAISAMPRGWGQLAMRRVQLEITVLPRSPFSRLALPVTGGLLCLLAACKQQH